jgi:hypothetical protein
MNLVKRSWLVVLLTLFVGAGTGVAQGFYCWRNNGREI